MKNEHEKKEKKEKKGERREKNDHMKKLKLSILFPEKDSSPTTAPKFYS